jgi:hypothetical protein
MQPEFYIGKSKHSTQETFQTISPVYFIEDIFQNLLSAEAENHCL